jgi:hypothetical protein
VDETYRMLGREHEADLAREAQTRKLAASAREARPARMRDTKHFVARKRTWFVPARLAAFLR